MANITNVREFVINALKQYHNQQLTVEARVVNEIVDGKLTDYVEKEEGKGLSEANFTADEKTKLAGIETGAQVNVQSDWNAASGDAQILNKPSLDGYFDYANYANEQIVFKNGGANGTTLFTINCADFLVDGMVENVSIKQYSTADQATNGTSYLFVDFNTVSGKTDIKIPLKDIFDPNNYYDKDATDNLLDTKVDKVNGKQLSTEDYTTAEKTKLSGIAEGAQVNVIESVSVDGTALPVSAKGVNIDLSNKVDKVEGKGLSEADFTSAEKTKLSGIATGAQVNVIESVKVNNEALTPDANKAVNITVPTKTSDLTNDSNFAADANYIHTDNNYTTAEKNKLNDIQANAQVNTIETIKVNGVAQTVTDKAVDINVPTVPTISFSGTKANDGSDYTYVANGFSASGHEITVSYTSVLTSHQDISGKEDTSNKKTSLSVAANISDTYYPTTSAVTTYIGPIEELSTTELNSIFATE